MKFNLNRDFHGKINYFPSSVHQYKKDVGKDFFHLQMKLVWMQIFSIPSQQQWESTRVHRFHFSVHFTVIIFHSVAFISCALSLISQSEDESIFVKATHDSFGLLCGQT